MKRLCILLGAVMLGTAPGVGLLSGTADATSTALLVGGHGEHAQLTEEEMSTALGGYFARYDTRIGVPFVDTGDYTTKLAVSADALYAAVYDTPGFETIGGVSEGAPAVSLVLNRLMNDRAHPEAGHIAPDPSDMNVAVYGYVSRMMFFGSGSRYVPLPVTPYDTLIVKAEYDGIADFPDRPLHLLAVVNALMGAQELHVDAAYSDIMKQPTKYTITTNALGGTTTTVLIPTPVLPLLTPLRDAGAPPQVLATMDRILRPIINTAYRRPRWQVGIPETVLAPVPSVPADAGPASIPASTVLPTRHTKKAPAISEDDGAADHRRRADTTRSSRLVARLQHSLRHGQQDLSRRHAVPRRQDGVAQTGDHGG